MLFSGGMLDCHGGLEAVERVLIGVRILMTSVYSWRHDVMRAGQQGMRKGFHSTYVPTVMHLISTYAHIYVRIYILLGQWVGTAGLQGPYLHLNKLCSLSQRPRIVVQSHFFAMILGFTRLSSREVFSAPPLTLLRHSLPLWRACTPMQSVAVPKPWRLPLED